MIVFCLCECYIFEVLQFDVCGVSICMLYVFMCVNIVAVSYVQTEFTSCVFSGRSILQLRIKTFKP